MKRSTKCILAAAFCAVIAYMFWSQRSHERKMYLEATRLLDEYCGERADLDQAGELLTRILKRNPYSAQAHVGLSRLMIKAGYVQGDQYRQDALDKAEELMKKAIESDADFYDAYYYGAGLYVIREELEKAREMAEIAEDLAPDAARTQLIYAYIANAEDYYYEVVERAEAALAKTDKKSTKAAAYSVLADLYRRYDELYNARDTYEKWLALDPDNPWLLDSCAMVRYAMNDIDGAIEFDEKALSIMDFGVARRRLGQSYYKKGHQLLWEKEASREAIGYLEKALKYKPEADVYYCLGIACWRVGWKNRDIKMMQRAEHALKRALELEPDHALAREQLRRLRPQ